MDTNSAVPLSYVILPAAISAAAALLGVATGGWITSHNQTKDRRQNHIREQLEKFYAPLLAIRKEIRAKSETRVKVHAAAGATWQTELEGTFGDPEKLKLVDKSEGAKYQKLHAYSGEQLKNELVPLYEKMLKHFTKNIWLAEPSTLQHFDALVEYVELWKRGLAESLPYKVAVTLNHDETKMYPFYDDVETQFRKLQQELAK